MSRIHKTTKGTELPLMDMRGKDYLEVKWRLVWFREERPDWSIETDFLSVDQTSALAKAIIKDAQGRVVATGHKYEDKQGFGDYREKAETGAIGRALALIGYGTQFCADELDEGERLADSPVQRQPVAQAARPAVVGTIRPPASQPACEQCGQPLMTSRYNPNEWYCSPCKIRKPKVPA